MWRACLVACAISTSAFADVGVIAPSAERAALIAASGGRDGIAVARAALAEGAVPIETIARFRHVRELVDEGWGAYLQVSIDFAAQRLAAARTEAEQLAALPGGMELYADASLRLGAVLAKLGRDDESRAALQLALALDPDRPVTLAEFSPDVVEAVDAVRALPRVNQRTRITADGLISVDGKELGRGPLELDLPRGQHLIVARAPLFHPLARAVNITESASTFRLELERDEDASALAAGPGGDARAVAEAALRFGDFSEVVLAAPAERRGAPAILVQRCAGLPAQCTAVIEIGYVDGGLAAAAHAAWQSATTAELRYPPSVFGERTAPPVAHRPLWKSPYVWGGAAVAAAAVVATVLVLTSSSPQPAHVLINPPDFTR